MVSPRSSVLAAAALGAALLCAAAGWVADRGLADAWLAGAIVGAVALVPAACAAVALHLAQRRDGARRARRERLDELLRASGAETESQSLLLDHASRVVPGAGAALLVRVDSQHRLTPVLGDRIADTPLRGLLVGHPRPEACLAQRLGRTETRGASPSPAAACELCGRLPGESVCEPLHAGDRTLGSLLVCSVDPIGRAAREELHDTAARTAPVLGLQRLVAAAESHAARDPLTGLPNRRAASEALARLCAQAGRTVTPLAAVLVDLDRFAALNDRIGLERADGALVAVASSLTAGVRASDFLARYGGQAFLVLAPDTGRVGAAALAEKLRRDIAELSPVGIGPMTASFGVAALPDDAADGDGLIRGAERALGVAKALGRNRVATPQPDVTPGG